MTEKKEHKKNIAVIRIRGMTGIRGDISDTLDLLNLSSKFSCVVLESKPEFLGMVKKVKDFVTWGEIDSVVEKELNSKRGVEGKKTFRLAPPVGGFEGFAMSRWYAPSV